MLKGGEGSTAEHPQALTHPSGRVRRGVPSPSPRVPGPPRRGAQPGTGASWLRGRGDHRSLRQRAAPALRGGQREPGGGSALPAPSRTPGGPHNTQPPPPRRPQAPLAFPVVAAPRRHLCCPTSAAARRDRTAEKSGLERLPRRRGARRDGRTSSCSAP